MKKLRKVLALVLAAVMMASLIVSASALSTKDYTDHSEVVNKKAVVMLTELGIISGYPDGDFRPAGTVTRAEMAKMIYVILNSGNDRATASDTQRYSDVDADSWAAGYIAFCDDLGIITGMGDGSFAPSAPVTAVQAARMLLAAMGYDAEKEGFTGADWEQNVIKTAAKAGLLEGFTASVNESCTRDNAALLVCNALTGDRVSYTGSTAVAAGDTLIGTCYGLVEVTGVVVANEYANLFGEEPLAAGLTEIALIGEGDEVIDPLMDSWLEIDWQEVVELGLERLSLDGELVDDITGMTGSLAYSALMDITPEDIEPYRETILELADCVQNESEYTSVVFNAETSLEQVGKTVTVYARLEGDYEQSISPVEYAKRDMFSGEVIGGVAEHEDCVTAYNNGAAAEAETVLTDCGTRYFENYAAVWALPDGIRPYAYADSDSSYADIGVYLWSEDEMTSVRGEYVEYIDADGDGVAEIVSRLRQTFAVVEYDEDSRTYSFSENNKAVDLINWEDIPAEDIIFDGGSLEDGMKVLVMPIDGKYYVREAAVVTGTVERIGCDSDMEYFAVVEGVGYYESGLYWANDIEVGSSDGDIKAFFYNISENMETGKEYTLYLDDFGNVVAFEAAE